MEDITNSFQLKGEEEVRKSLALGQFNEQKARAAHAWLSSLERKAAEVSRTNDANYRDLELETARSAARAAWFAVAISVVALLVSLLAYCSGKSTT